jgi:ATP-dependent protease Clp ATPase subunit
VCEEIMLDMMYRLPDEGQGGKYVIDESVVDGRRNVFEIKPSERRRESA